MGGEHIVQARFVYRQVTGGYFRDKLGVFVKPDDVEPPRHCSGGHVEAEMRQACKSDDGFGHASALSRARSFLKMKANEQIYH